MQEYEAKNPLFEADRKERGFRSPAMKEFVDAYLDLKEEIDKGGIINNRYLTEAGETSEAEAKLHEAMRKAIQLVSAGKKLDGNGFQHMRHFFQDRFELSHPVFCAQLFRAAWKGRTLLSPDVIKAVHLGARPLTKKIERI